MTLILSDLVLTNHRKSHDGYDGSDLMHGVSKYVEARKDEQKASTIFYLR